MPDDELVRQARRVTFLSALVALIGGGLSAGVSVYVDNHFEEAPWTVHYGWLVGVTLVATVLELLLLFAISLRVVQILARICGFGKLDDEDPLVREMLPGLLARAALEIPDPVERVLGVDPLGDVSKKQVLLFTLLYKIKVGASNFVAKQLLRRALGRAVLRISVAYTAVLITGAWNAFVLWKVAREARLRLFGTLIVKRIMGIVSLPGTLERLSPRARLACVQAVGNSLRLTRKAHPNYLLLLRKLAGAFDIAEGEPLDDWPKLLSNLRALPAQERAFVCDLLAVAVALDGKLSRREERCLGQAFGEHHAVYLQRIRRLTRLIGSGRLSEALRECGLDFELG